MGYYYETDISYFRSALSVDEIKAFRDKILEARPTIFESFEMLEEVSIRRYETSFGLSEVKMEFSQASQKWDYGADKALAIFISFVIHDDDYCDVLSEGSDGEKWGWRVTKNSLIAQELIWRVIPDSLELFDKETLVEKLI